MASTAEEPRQGSRRRFQRFPLKVPAVFFWKGPRGSRQKAEGETRDISADGVFILTENGPPADSVIEFELRLPALDATGPALRIRAMGQVVRTDSTSGNFARGFAVHSTRKFVLARRAVSNTGLGAHC